jgi:hypothetical protein
MTHVFCFRFRIASARRWTAAAMVSDATLPARLQGRTGAYWRTSTNDMISEPVMVDSFLLDQ